MNTRALTAQIERLTAERDDIQERFERLGAAGDVYMRELRDEIAHLGKANADLIAAALRVLDWYPSEVIQQSTDNSDQGWQDLKALAAAVKQATGRGEG